jgi:hypothetical protein
MEAPVGLAAKAASVVGVAGSQFCWSFLWRLPSLCTSLIVSGTKRTSSLGCRNSDKQQADLSKHAG